MAKNGVTTSFGLLILRLGIGGFMAMHGWGKLQMVLEGNMEFAGDPIGIGAKLSTLLLTSAEFGCAILVAAGFLTRLAAIPIAFAMGVAAFTAHANDPWLMQPNGGSKEPAMLFLIPFVALVFTGAGMFSIDALLFGRRAATQPPQSPPT